MSVSQDNLNTGFGPPPLATPISGNGPDEFGVPYQSRGLASGNLQVSWAAWFNSIFARVKTLPVIQDTRANRANYQALQYPNFLYRETDSTLMYISLSNVWTYQGGTYARTQAQLAALAATLTAADNGLRVNVTDYAHMLMWTNPAWGWAPEDPHDAGNIAFFDVNPGTGWGLMDGSGNIAILKADGTTRNNANAVALANVYVRAAAAYNGAITAAVVPTISTPTFSGTASSTSATAGLRSINNGAGGTLVGAGAVLNDIPASNHTHPYTPAGTISTPTATLPADPIAHTDALIYIRK